MSSTKYVEVEIDLADFDVDDLVDELERRKREIPGGVDQAQIERLYYATRGGATLNASQTEEVHDLLANMCGRAT